MSWRAWAPALAVRDAPPLLVRRLPGVVLPVEDGWLMGSVRGEFGGELVSRTPDGTNIEVFADNIRDLFRVGDQTIALTGIAHMFVTAGCLRRSRVTRTADGRLRRVVRSRPRRRRRGMSVATHCW